MMDWREYCEARDYQHEFAIESTSRWAWLVDAIQCVLAWMRR